jgi:2-dehydro-3-deoxyphosphogluconate aldolase / (4S)-4-hydroxy-2-oxoglutarate aldolase
MTTLTQIIEHKIVAIVRGLQPDEVVKVAGALYAGGIKIIEVTLNSPDALTAIEKLKNAYGHQMLVGAGTVLSPKDAADAISAGAVFLISPNTDITVIKATKDAGIVSIPGAFTPSEIVTAHNNGADIVKVFPASDASYIKDVLAPLNHIRLMPTGGINLNNIKAFGEAGATAFGIASSLVNNQLVINETYLKQLSVTAADFVAAIR